MKLLFQSFLFAGLALLTACQSPPPPTGVKIGKPYSISGKTYYPAYEPDYDETGIASWYGPGFHGKSTANGERFNTHDFTAAHPTLPMPSLVRVTNQKNGKSVVVRINDRGPFAHGRIIDLSRAAAKRLDIHGLEKVRVQYMKTETEQYLAGRKEGREIDMAEYNEQLDNGENQFAQIIETIDSSQQLGQEVSAAAPLTSVSSNDLPNDNGFFISSAHADEVKPPVLLANNNPIGKEVVLRKAGDPTPPKTILEPKNDVQSAAGFYVQAGSFASETNARKLGKQITAFAPATVAKVLAGNGHWWRVRAGPFSSEEAAHSALAAVVNMGAPDARIVKE